MSDPFLKQQYRSTLGITGDILDACMNAGMNGMLVTEISRRANLSHNAVIENCKKLAKSGLTESVRTQRHHLIRITSKGMQFYQELQKFQQVTREFNIRY